MFKVRRLPLVVLSLSLLDACGRGETNAQRSHVLADDQSSTLSLNSEAKAESFLGKLLVANLKCQNRYEYWVMQQGICSLMGGQKADTVKVEFSLNQGQSGLALAMRRFAGFQTPAISDPGSDILRVRHKERQEGIFVPSMIEHSFSFEATTKTSPLRFSTVDAVVWRQGNSFNSCKLGENRFHIKYDCESINVPQDVAVNPAFETIQSPEPGEEFFRVRQGHVEAGLEIAPANPFSSGRVGDYRSAMTACESLEYASEADWRLPTSEELQNLGAEGLLYMDSRFSTGNRAYLYWGHVSGQTAQERLRTCMQRCSDLGGGAVLMCQNACIRIFPRSAHGEIAELQYGSIYGNAEEQSASAFCVRE